MRVLWICWLAVLMAVSGCVSEPPIPGASPALLDFLQQGEVTRKDVILQLGEPSSSFEDDSILTWRIGENPKQGMYVITPSMIGWHARYSLVLTFNEAGVLEEISRIPVQ